MNENQMDISAQQRIDELEQKIALLERENKRTSRQLTSLQGLVERNKLMSQTQQKLSATIQAARSKQEEYMNLLLANCPDVILMFDEEDRLAYCTDEFLRRINLRSFAPINGCEFSVLFGDYMSAAWRQILGDAIRKAKSDRVVVEIDSLLGRSDLGRPQRNYSVQVTPMIGDHGEAVGSMALLHDQTEIISTRDQAEYASRAKSDFLATVSHEIRTPMNAVIGISDMLKKTELTAEQHDHLSNIQNSSYVLLNLINDILDISKIEAGKFELVRDYFHLGHLLESLKMTFEVMMEQRNLHFHCEFAKNLPEVVYGDEKRLRQVLTNLLTNAQKYTESGSVWFRAKCLADGALKFEVEDTGIGIRKEDIPRLCNAFEQLDQVRNKKVIGTGLGLAIASNLCKMMDGVVEVESEYGKGSVFSVTVRLGRGTMEDLAAEIAMSDLQFVAPKARVLLVDDIEINLVIASAMLSEYEITPDEAVNGIKALEMVEKNNYDLILMDHMMPEMDGIEATRLIRAMDGKRATVPIIALTANAVSSAVVTFLSNGFNDFVSKPIDKLQLARCLYKWLPPHRVQTK